MGDSVGHDVGVRPVRRLTWRCCSTTPLLQSYPSLNSQSETTKTSLFSQSTNRWEKSARAWLASEYVWWAVAACPWCVSSSGEWTLRHLWPRPILSGRGAKKKLFAVWVIDFYLSANTDTKRENAKNSKIQGEGEPGDKEKNWTDFMANNHLGGVRLRQLPK